MVGEDAWRMAGQEALSVIWPEDLLNFLWGQAMTITTSTSLAIA